MTSSALSLSLLSRGVGSIKRNGHETVDVLLEPEDYFNFSTSPGLGAGGVGGVSESQASASTRSSRVILPPLQPRYAFHDPDISPHPPQMRMPRTFTTRKGALLLFSEEYAQKYEDGEADGERDLDRLDLRTFGDLAKSILSYGGNNNDGINLKFSTSKSMVARRIRPGFSARRYLSRLTKSFDDSFLENLTAKGYIHEKTLFDTNSLLPHLRRRINDDLSSMPLPYRIMKYMLMSPGLLSGFSFAKIPTGYSENTLSMVREEDELRDDDRDFDRSGGEGHPGTARGGEGHESARSHMQLQIVDISSGVHRHIQYADLDHREKENVLADLLVKSAINHALEKQKQKMFEDASAESASAALSVDGRQSAKSSASGTVNLTEFDMAEAVRTYLESQIEMTSTGAPNPSAGAPNLGTGAPASTSSVVSGSFRGNKLSSHSSRAAPFEIPPKTLPVIVGDKEYVGAVPVASLKETSSSGTSTPRSILSVRGEGVVGGGAGGALPPALSPIQSVPGSGLVSKEVTFNPTPVLPPIADVDQGKGASLHPPAVPLVNVMPPTPQATTLTEKHEQEAETAEQKPETKRESDVEEEAEDSWAGSRYGRSRRDEGAGLAGSDVMSDKSSSRQSRDKHGRKKKASISSQSGSTSSKPSPRSVVLGEDLPAYDEAAHRRVPQVKSSSGSVASSRKDEGGSDRGGVVIAPDGEVVSIGGSVASKHRGDDDASLSAVSHAQHPTGAGAARSEVSSDAWPRAAGTQKTAAQHKMEGFLKHTEEDSRSTQVFSQPLTEQELVSTLTEHAHKIASTVLSRHDTGRDLSADAQVAAEYWLSMAPDRVLSTRSLQERQRITAIEQFLESRDGTRSANPTTQEYKQLLKNILTNVVGSQSGSDGVNLAEAEVAEELIEALSKFSLNPEDIEVVTDETGRSVIRSRVSVGAAGGGGSGTGSGVQIPGADGDASVRSGDQTSSLPNDILSSDRSQQRSSARSQAKQLSGAGGGSSTASGAGGGAGPGEQGTAASVTSSSGVQQDGAATRMARIPLEEANAALLDSQSGLTSSATSLHGEAGGGAGDGGTHAPGVDQLPWPMEQAGPAGPGSAVSSAHAPGLAGGVSGGSTLQPGGAGGAAGGAAGGGSVAGSRVGSVAGKSQLSMASKHESGRKTTESGGAVSRSMSESSKHSGNKSKSSLDNRDEFVVPAKMDDKMALNKLYGELQSSGLAQKPGRQDLKKKKGKPTAVKPGKKAGGPKRGKKGAQKKAKKEDGETETPPKDEEHSDDSAKSQPSAASGSPVTSSPHEEGDGDEEEEMEFIIVRDEFPDTESEASPMGHHTIKSAMSDVTDLEAAISQLEIKTPEGFDEMTKEEQRLHSINNREARAAKRAAQAAKKRELMEQRRREREQQIKKEREDAEKREQMAVELEEERKRREEEKRLLKQQKEEEEMAVEKAEREQEERERREKEREQRMREEFARKREMMKAKQLEEERIKAEEEAARQKQLEEERRIEAILLSRMAEEERLEYERKKKEEEERRIREEEEEKQRREEELRRQMEEARRLAEELAQKQLEFKKRLEFVQSLHTEAVGLARSQNITRAFVFSYFELLQFLGLDVPEFERLKATLKF